MSRIPTAYEVLISVGAGWRSFTVSLVAEDKVPQFIEKLRRSYGPFTKLNDEEAAEVIFVTKPSSDACGERWAIDSIFLVRSQMGLI